MRTMTLAIILVLAVTPGHAQQSSADTTPIALLGQLAGHWVMTGTLGGKPITHDVDATWLLKREYLQFHEVSREKDATGVPAYEAIVLIGWDAKTNEYGCLWLDNTAVWDFSAHGLARGKKAGNSIPLVIILSARESMHTTFRYDPLTDTWELTIDDVTGGKTDRFGAVRLTRA